MSHMESIFLWYHIIEDAMFRLYSLAFWTSAISAVSIPNIQGTSFKSSFNGQTVNNVTGVVTAKVSGSSGGFFFQADPVVDIRASHGIWVFTPSATILASFAVGDKLSLTAKVEEWRAAARPNDLFLTELTSPTDIVVLSSSNAVAPLVLGKDRSPPTEAWSSLDTGSDGFLSLPNNQSLIEVANPGLQPDKYGLDFWQSLEGVLVRVPKPTALNFESSRGEFWIHGDWKVTGKNKRGGLSLNIGPDGIPDANPEVLFVGSPLDGSRNPKVAIGVGLDDIVGIIKYQFGFYYVLPLTAPVVVSTPSSEVPPTTITSSETDSCALTIGDYNVENMAPNSTHIPTIAKHISTHLGTPDLMFVQEIQDNSGPTSDGQTSANVTLTRLVEAIAAVNNVTYSFVEIAPQDGKDGGQPGGNIRQAYLYKTSKLKLATGVSAGGALDPVRVIRGKGKGKRPTLTINPGRIDPENPAWNDSRKPLAAEWISDCGKTLFTVNVHFASKGGSSSTQGDARPPVNLPAETRQSQMQAVANFVESILEKDRAANIIVGGDFNEYTQSRTVFSPLHKFLTEIDEVAKIPEYERYTYIFDQNTQQLDHILISDSLKKRKVEAEHIHINNWAPTFASRTSDHDPSVAKVRLC